jgi:hypothetical protein
LRLPRWTIWPAILVLALFLVAALPWRDSSSGENAHKRVVVLGIDGMDPEILQEAIAKYPDRMKNFARLIAEGGIHSLATSDPPQSPSRGRGFITGLIRAARRVRPIQRDPLTREVASPTTASKSHHVGL